MLAWVTAKKKCAHCRRTMPLDLIHIDHIVPIARGGTDALNNLQVLCATCNRLKGNLLEKESNELLHGDYPLKEAYVTILANVKDITKEEWTHYLPYFDKETEKILLELAEYMDAMWKSPQFEV